MGEIPSEAFEASAIGIGVGLFFPIWVGDAVWSLTRAWPPRFEKLWDAHGTWTPVWLGIVDVKTDRSLMRDSFPNVFAPLSY